MYKMLININDVKVNDRIRKDFGNIEELANDIKENGLINPPVVTPDNELIAGERRLRACKTLGFQQIEVRVMSVKDSEHQLQIEISENENRKDFTFSERVDWAKRLERVERIKARSNQGMRTDLTSDKILSNVDANKETALESGFGNKETYRQAKYITDNASEEMIKDLDDGKLSVNKAYITLKQEKENLSKDKQSLETQLRQALSKQPKIIDNTDYDTIDSLKSQLQSKNKDVEKLKRDQDLLERKVKLNEEDAKKFNDLKTQIEFLSKEKDDIARQITSATELSGLSVKIDKFLKTELSPIRYSRTLERMDSEVAVNNLQDIIESVESWCVDMRMYLPNNKNNNKIIDVEVLR